MQTKENIRENHRRWRQKNKEKKYAYIKEWRRKNPEKVRQYFKTWYEKGGKNRTISEEAKFKNTARYKLRDAVKVGKIVRGKCERCGSEDVHGHHEDYNKALEVNWLCYKHHRERHNEMGNPIFK